MHTDVNCELFKVWIYVHDRPDTFSSVNKIKALDLEATKHVNCSIYVHDGLETFSSVNKIKA